MDYVDLGVEIVGMADYEEASELLVRKIESALVSYTIYFYKTVKIYFNLLAFALEV
jgi:hypothetical protein